MSHDVKPFYIEEIQLPFTGAAITGAPVYNESGVDDHTRHLILLPDEQDPMDPLINYKSKRCL